MADDKIYDLTLISRDLGETVRLPDGNEHPLVRIDPEASFEGLFVRSGKLTVWVTRGTACLMTRLDAIVPVARVRIHLAAVTPPPIANSPPIAPP